MMPLDLLAWVHDFIGKFGHEGQLLLLTWVVYEQRKQRARIRRLEIEAGIKTDPGIEMG